MCIEQREFHHGQQISEAKAKLPAASLPDSAKLKGKIAAAERQQPIFFGKKPYVKLVGLKLKRPNSVIEYLVTEDSEMQSGFIDC